MKASEYREQIEKRHASRRTLETAFEPTPPSVPEDIETLRKSDMSDDERYEALRRLGAASFGIDGFAEFRVDYLEALREVVRTDAGSRTGMAALEILATENDAFVQGFLKDCLANSENCVIPPAQALRLLAIDDHADFTEIARRLFAESEDVDVKAEALRALAADPAAEAMMSEIFSDKSGNVALRKIAGAALRQFNPIAFGEHAISVLADTSEDDTLRAASMTTLTNIAGTLDAKQRADISAKVGALSNESEIIGETAKRLSERLKDDGRGRALESALVEEPGLIVTKSFE